MQFSLESEHGHSDALGDTTEGTQTNRKQDGSVEDAAFSAGGLLLESVEKEMDSEGWQTTLTRSGGRKSEGISSGTRIITCIYRDVNGAKSCSSLLRQNAATHPTVGIHSTRPQRLHRYHASFRVDTAQRSPTKVLPNVANLQSGVI